MLYETNFSPRLRARFCLNQTITLANLRQVLAGLSLLCFAALGATNSVYAQQGMVVEPVKTTISMLDSTREQDGLVGPVRRIHTEMSKVTVNAGTVVEEPRMLTEITTYDPQGKRIWNVYYPVNSGTFKGNQEFKYDDQGHVTEMALRDDTGRIISREAYTYEYDRFGNWTKMTSSLVIIEADKMVYEPFEVTSRAISYYYADPVASIVQSPPSPTGVAVGQPGPNASASSPVNSPKTIAEKPREVVKEPEATIPASSNATTEKPLDALKAGNDSPKKETDLEKQDVEVSSSPVQAYQLPAVPSPASTVNKPTVSGGVVSGKILSLPKPIYPPMALTRGVYGKVVVEVTIDEKGQVVDARALSGNPVLRMSAITAAKQARFEPTLLSGRPVKATRIINFDFNGQ